MKETIQESLSLVVTHVLWTENNLSNISLIYRPTVAAICNFIKTDDIYFVFPVQKKQANSSHAVLTFRVRHL